MTVVSMIPYFIFGGFAIFGILVFIGWLIGRGLAALGVGE